MMKHPLPIYITIPAVHHHVDHDVINAYTHRHRRHLLCGDKANYDKELMTAEHHIRRFMMLVTSILLAALLLVGYDAFVSAPERSNDLLIHKDHHNPSFSFNQDPTFRMDHRMVHDHHLHERIWDELLMNHSQSYPLYDGRAAALGGQNQRLGVGILIVQICVREQGA
mmetsp:Transcript_2189/g.5032  ORF Transcript_2189/g.5032 Transcript_2189/m.5032 type:complete len:168 (-) Transcript_2189:733-1236(-)